MDSLHLIVKWRMGIITKTWSGRKPDDILRDSEEPERLVEY